MTQPGKPCRLVSITTYIAAFVITRLEDILELFQGCRIFVGDFVQEGGRW